jgi:uncharacterized radical SAM superfamily Fe-S cluster-containing enzyme
MGEKYNRVKDNMIKIVKCLCPKCRKNYYRKLYWSGNGMPRIYCQYCRHHTSISDVLYDDPQIIRLSY